MLSAIFVLIEIQSIRCLLVQPALDRWHAYYLLWLLNSQCICGRVKHSKLCANLTYLIYIYLYIVRNVLCEAINQFLWLCMRHAILSTCCILWLLCYFGFVVQLKLCKKTQRWLWEQLMSNWSFVKHTNKRKTPSNEDRSPLCEMHLLHLFNINISMWASNY